MDHERKVTKQQRYTNVRNQIIFGFFESAIIILIVIILAASYSPWTLIDGRYVADEVVIYLMLYGGLYCLYVARRLYLVCSWTCIDNPRLN